VILTGVAEPTVPAFSEKEADVEPFGTLIDEGTFKAVVLEVDKEMVMPAPSAGAVKLTVPVPDWPLTRPVGLIERLFSAGGGGLIVTAEVVVIPE